MTTLIVHGTLAYGGSWYQRSWGQRGFLAGLQRGMMDTSGWHDIWSVGEEPVSSYPELGGVFEWNGLPAGLYRGTGATAFAAYLNAVAELTDEPIRVIAHSHGCNVVKLASSLRELSPRVAIDQAAFLACPHFYEDLYEQEEPSSWEERVNIRKVHAGYKKTGHRFRYRLDPARFGRILNLYCERDEVQVDLAQSLSGGQVPLTGNFLENVLEQMGGGIFENPQAARWEMDPEAQHVYENLSVEVESRCSNRKAHSVMHGAVIGVLCGIWLNSGRSMQEVLRELGDLPALPADDMGG
jgi:hypothetical protein